MPRNGLLVIVSCTEEWLKKPLLVLLCNSDSFVANRNIDSNLTTFNGVFVIIKGHCDLFARMREVYCVLNQVYDYSLCASAVDQNLLILALILFED